MLRIDRSGRIARARYRVKTDDRDEQGPARRDQPKMHVCINAFGHCQSAKPERHLLGLVGVLVTHIAEQLW
jgi:hypothetical protein